MRISVSSWASGDCVLHARYARRLREPAHGWPSARPCKMFTWHSKCAGTVSVMSMARLVIASALGFIVAQGVLYSVRQFAGWVQRDEVRTRLRTLAPSPGPAIIAGFVKYAAPIGAGAALITLGVWALSDYFAAKSARSATLAAMLDSPAPAHASPSPSAQEETAAAPLPTAEPVAEAPAEDADPYKDPDFRVHRRSHRPGSMSLKESILQRAEVRARADLLTETQQHLNRSQYDCEAADRADRYIKAGLDVWGFAAWQLKHFPMDSYKGATLAQCRDIKNIVDPGRLDLQSTVAQDNHP